MLAPFWVEIPSLGGASLCHYCTLPTSSLSCTLQCPKVLKVQSAILSSKRIGGNFPRANTASTTAVQQKPALWECPARPSRSPVPGVHASLKAGSLQVATLRYEVQKPRGNRALQMWGLLSARGRSSKASMSCPQCKLVPACRADSKQRVSHFESRTTVSGLPSLNCTGRAAQKP